MTIWAMQNVMGRAPPRGVLAEVVRQQTALDTDAMRAALRDPQAAALLGGDVAAAIEATDEIPRFVIETLMGAYVKGFAFVFAVEARGWTEVEKLYGEYPPQSTEQILHPEKWFARESPALFEWPALAEQAALADWQPLEENVLGEIQWRIVFAEHGLAAEAEAAAGGWDGDRYAVLRHRATGELLLLARTGWDSEADAEEFAGAYRRLLAVKYADRAVPTRVERRGTDVLIVEGGSDAALDAHAAFLHGASKTRR